MDEMIKLFKSDDNNTPHLHENNNTQAECVVLWVKKEDRPVCNTHINFFTGWKQAILQPSDAPKHSYIDSDDDDIPDLIPCQYVSSDNDILKDEQ